MKTLFTALIAILVSSAAQAATSCGTTHIVKVEGNYENRTLVHSDLVENVQWSGAEKKIPNAFKGAFDKIEFTIEHISTMPGGDGIEELKILGQKPENCVSIYISSGIRTTCTPKAGEVIRVSCWN